jgi:excisionase family DNA binding protein
MPNERERWMSTTEIAALLGVERQTVSRWIRQNRLHARAIVGPSGEKVVYRVRYSDFMEFVRRYVRDND